MAWHKTDKYSAWEEDINSYEEWVTEILPLVPSNIDESLIPAWSLHRLVSMIEEGFQSDGRFFCLPMFGFDKSYNLYDNIIDAYAWLIKEGYFNKEYLV